MLNNYTSLALIVALFMRDKIMVWAVRLFVITMFILISLYGACIVYREWQTVLS